MLAFGRSTITFVLLLWVFSLSQTSANSLSSTVESIASASATTAADKEFIIPGGTIEHNTMDASNDPILIVFSDVDGTLVHYPEKGKNDKEDNELQQQPKNSILQLPPSKTGLRGVISSQTLFQCKQIRKQQAKLVIVSGMRTSTLLKRLPFLPLADAYCSESGRIFYPKDVNKNPSMVFTPEKYDGASKEDSLPFGIVEDLEWRNRMEQALGSRDSFMGVFPFEEEDEVPLSERKGLLWEFARQLLADGYVLDTQGYATCFRINKKQQTSRSFDDLLKSLSSSESILPSGLAISLNLGCLDVYPISSGKKNCCEYLASKFAVGYPNALERNCVCLCDDDNDLEMALACSHAYLPGITSASMAEAIKKKPEHYTPTCGSGEIVVMEGTCTSTEAALTLVLKQVTDRTAAPSIDEKVGP